MSPLEYLGAAIAEWPLYVALATIFLVLHAPLISRWTVGFYDPLFMLLVSHALGWAIVWFMFVRGDIGRFYALSFSAAQLGLYLGLEVFRRFGRRPFGGPIPSDGLSLPKLILLIALAAHLTTTLATWALAGIPLLRDTRLGAFQGSGGFGILERLAESAWMIAVFSLVFLGLRRRGLLTHPLLLLIWAWLLISVALSGSKGALLILVQCVLSIGFVYGWLRTADGRFWGGRAGKLMIVAASLFAVAVLTLQQEGDVGLAGIGLLYRIVSYGDVYIFAYPDATIEGLRGANPLVGMFGGFLSTFRLFPQDLLHPNLGYQLAGIVFPELDIVVGPNPQHPVFGYHYFGQLGFVYSFFLGLLTMALHRRMYFHPHSSFVSGLVTFLVFFSLVGVSMDFEYSLSRLANTIIGLIVIVGPALLLHPHRVLWRRSGGRDGAGSLESPAGAARR